MVAVGVTPIQMKNATLTFAGDDYAAAVSSVEFTPSPQWILAQDIFGRRRRAVLASVSWVCRLGLLQDVDAASLHRYMLAHAGESKTVVFAPVSGGVAYTATVTLAPGAIGGTAAEMLAADVDLPVTDGPTAA